LPELWAPLYTYPASVRQDAATNSLIAYAYNTPTRTGAVTAGITASARLERERFYATDELSAVWCTGVACPGKRPKDSADVTSTRLKSPYPVKGRILVSSHAAAVTLTAAGKATLVTTTVRGDAAGGQEARQLQQALAEVTLPADARAPLEELAESLYQTNAAYALTGQSNSYTASPGN
jgi:hypothetical protein